MTKSTAKSQKTPFLKGSTTASTAPSKTSPKRGKGILVFFSEDEKAVIEDGASALGLSVTSFLRTTGLRMAAEAIKQRRELGLGL
jgi:uncharacterized protein (DUF1778 family)